MYYIYIYTHIANFRGSELREQSKKNKSKGTFK